VATTFNKLNTNQAGTNLGSEENAWNDQSSGGSRDASSSITFNTDGTISFAGTGVLNPTNTSPATNWNTNGGTHLSYEVLSFSNTVNATAAVTGGLAASTFLGENRHSLGSSFALTTTATWPTNGGTNVYEGVVDIKVSIWDASSGGRRTAYGIYRASCFAGSFI
jgi:hypothetical protein